MLGFDAQNRVNEALRRIDQALAADMELEQAVQQHAQNFRDTIFAALQYIERESLQLKALLVQTRRLDANQLHVQIKGRGAFVASIDPELAYERKTQAEATAQSQPELAARLFMVLAPPYHGLLRHYTIFGDGTWKRTTFSMGANGITAQSALLQRFSPDVLVLEACDLIGYVSTLHPSWTGLAQSAETLTAETIRDRLRVKSNLMGLATVRLPRLESGERS